MVKLRDGQELPSSEGSHKKVVLVCDCGREFLSQYKYFNFRDIKSCGRCKTHIFKTKLHTKQFGRLVFDDDVSLCETTNQKMWWRCSCGTRKQIVVKSVCNGLTTSCGCGSGTSGRKYTKPVMIQKQDWLNSDLPLKLLDENLPNEWSKRSVTKMKWQCSCGNVFLAKFGHITSGHTKTCGKCDFIWLSDIKKFKNLTLVYDENRMVHKNTTEKLKWKCSCGKFKMIPLDAVNGNPNRTCGDCYKIQPHEILGKRFGNLTVVECHHKTYSKFSEKLVTCKCVCGSVKQYGFAGLVDRSIGCGECSVSTAGFWDGVEIEQGPLPQERLSELMKGFTIEPLSGCKNKSGKIKARCLLCGNEFSPSISDILNRGVFSCGCVNNRVSRLSSSIGYMLDKHGIDFKFEHHIGKLYKLDVFIPDRKLGIEVNGLKWHTDETKQRESNKIDICRSQNIDLMMFFGDEIRLKKEICENIIINRLGVRKKKKIRASKTKIGLIYHSVASDFYDRFHIQGKCRSKYHIGLFYEDKLLMCMSIRKPSRQNSGDWEISRMASDFEFSVYGGWSKMISWIGKNQLIKGRIITFSDDRLFNGNTYEKIGMRKIHKIPRDYFYTDLNIRHHKSKFRSDEKLTEKQKIGKMHKIWDYGKTKWGMEI